MALPSSVSTITIKGTYVDFQGVPPPAGSTVAFSPPANVFLKVTDVDVLVTPKTLVATLDALGAFTIVLPVTDDPDVVPSFTYSVVEDIGGIRRSYNVSIPRALLPGPVDLSDLAPVGVTVTGTTALTKVIADALYAPIGSGGGGGGVGTVTKVNSVVPDGTGNVVLAVTDISGAVGTTDTRLSNQRVPTDASVTTAKIAAGGLAPSAVTGTAVVTGDARLSDNRTPIDGSVTTAKIAAGGLNPSAITGTAVVTGDARLSDQRVPTDASVTTAKIAAGGLAPSAVTGTAVITTDSRLSNPRTPTVHASTHATGGSDAITPASIGAATTASVAAKQDQWKIYASWTAANADASNIADNEVFFVQGP